MRVAAPADKRFRRAHVSPRRKRVLDRGTWTKAGIIAGAVVAVTTAAYVGITAIVSSTALTITTITVEGAVRMPEGVVQEELADLVGRGMFSVELDPWRDRVRQLSWVADASIRRVLPGTVAVTITERQPMAIGRIGDTLNVIDRRGVIIDAFGPNYKDLDLPIIDGLAYADDLEVGAIEQSRAALAVRLLSELQRTPDLANRLSQVDVSDERNAVVVIKGDTAQLFLGDTRFAERLQAYLDLAPTLRTDVPDVVTVDLRYGSRVFVRPGSAGRSARSKGVGGE
ncbi:MAG: FtsQ-type POTRA domain-containing protein [Vicinamibacterales bacterium]